MSPHSKFSKREGNHDKVFIFHFYFSWKMSIWKVNHSFATISMRKGIRQRVPWSESGCNGTALMTSCHLAPIDFSQGCRSVSLTLQKEETRYFLDWNPAANSARLEPTKPIIKPVRMELMLRCWIQASFFQKIWKFLLECDSFCAQGVGLVQALIFPATRSARCVSVQETNMQNIAELFYCSATRSGIIFRV